MKATRLLLGAALLLAGRAALEPPGVRAQELRMPRADVEFDESVDFAAFESYSWKDTGQVAEDPAMHTRIVWYVERELEKKGLKKSTDGPGELLVRYYAKKHESLRGTPSQGETRLPGGTGQLTTSVDFRKVLAGTLVVELQRAEDGKPVWRAATEYRSIDRQRIDAETKSAVRLLLSKYPPKKS